MSDETPAGFLRRLTGPAVAHSGDSAEKFKKLIQTQEALRAAEDAYERAPTPENGIAMAHLHGQVKALRALLPRLTVAGGKDA